MELTLKKIHPESVQAALSRAERYRLLNQPDQAESIARDILVVAPDHRGALRELGLALTDQLKGRPGCFAEAESCFKRIADAYETPYLLGLAHERLCRAHLARGADQASDREGLAELLWEALRLYALAEGRRPAGNDDALLRWNSIVRLLDQKPDLRAPLLAIIEEAKAETPAPANVDLGDSPPAGRR